ncbi:hypothetical protein ACFXTO_005162 [Malus domestica]
MKGQQLMAEFENLLLEAAGRTSSSGKTNSFVYSAATSGEQKGEAEAIAEADGALADIESNGTAVVGAVRAGMAATAPALEAAAGVRVPENDGRRHALTLTVSDYKRRRGLL